LFFRNIAADFRRITDLLEGKSWIVRVVYPFICPGFHALIFYRLIQANRRWRIPLFFYLFAMILRVLNTFTQWFWGICIASNSEIGPGLYIAHHGQIFVGVKSMGANCTIGHNVTVGRTEKEHGYPVIGDDVYFAPGCVVIGKIEIGDNVKIGPNAVVRRSVAPNSVVVAPPPRVVRLTSKEEWLREKETILEKAGVNNENESRRDKPRPEAKHASEPHKASPDRPGSVERKSSWHSDKHAASGGSGTDKRPRSRRPRYRGKNKPHHPAKDGQKSRADKHKGDGSNHYKPAKDKAGEGGHDNTDSSGRGYGWRDGDRQRKWVGEMDGEPLDG
jgi:serine acetyltransferase